MIDFDTYGRGNEYSEIAKNTTDPSYCDSISTPRGKASCYEQSDPEYAQYMQTCDLYTKHGDLESAYNSQVKCVVDMRIRKALENNADLNCKALWEEFQTNPYINNIVDQCEPIVQLQEVIKSGNPSMCSGYLEQSLSTRNYWPGSYMACLGFFVGSTDWDSACDYYANGLGWGPNPKSPPFDLMSLAKCSGYEKNYKIENVMDIFDLTPPPYQTPG